MKFIVSVLFFWKLDCGSHCLNGMKMKYIFVSFLTDLVFETTREEEMMRMNDRAWKINVMIAPTPVLHMLQQSSHASHMQSRVFTIFTSDRGLDLSHANLAHVNNTRVNVLLLMMFVYFSINSIATSRYFLSFQLCVLWLYLIACLQYNLYCR